MRMWMVDPKLLCRQHLLGEAREMHTLVGSILKGINISGSKYVTTGLVEVHNIRRRHDELAEEMILRGYNHKSPLPEVTLWSEGQVDSELNMIELRRRCPECEKRQKEFGII